MIPIWGGKPVKVITRSELEASDYPYFYDRLLEATESGTVPEKMPIHYKATSALVSLVKREGNTGEWEDKDWEFVEAVASDMEREIDTPPVILDKGRLVDGQHRIMAAVEAGIKKVPYLDVSDWQ